MVESIMNNCFILGAFSGLIAVLALYAHKTYGNGNNNEEDNNTYIKIFILVSILSCSAVFISQNCNTVSKKHIMSGGGSSINIHTGSPTF